MYRHYPPPPRPPPPPQPYTYSSKRPAVAGPSTLPQIRYPFMPSVPEPFEPQLAGEQQQQPPPPAFTGDPAFDILEWHPAYQSCQRYFLDHAQHEQATQALCALINIRLPFQYPTNPITSSTPPPSQSSPANPSYSFNFPRPGSTPNNSRSTAAAAAPPTTFVSAIPYLRRLIVTGFDKPAILHGFFGDDYARGILPHLDCERRNYLFAAKHGGWRHCKKQYDAGSGVGGDESVPFMKPLDEARVEELAAAEKAWSGWLAMEDWMVGPRAPAEESSTSGSQGTVGAAAAGNANEQPEGLPNGVAEAFQQQQGESSNGAMT